MRRLLSAIESSPSRRFTAVAAAFCVGTGLGTVVSAPALAVLPIAAGLICVRRCRVLALPFLFLAVGFLRGAWPLPNFPLPEGEARIEGRVVGEVEQRLSSQRAIVADVRVDGAPTGAGRVLVRLPLYPRVRTDDRLSFSCRLQRPEPIGTFPYDRYLAGRGILAVCWRTFDHAATPAPAPSVPGIILALKQWLVHRLGFALPEPSATFAAGLIFGGSSGLDPELQDAFSRSGLTHILAASGFNVSLFSALFYGWAAERFGRRRAIVLSMVLVAAYSVTAGAGPAVLRAALMAAVVLAGSWMRRRADTANLLLFAAVILLVWRPHALLTDPGFQLSFLATVGLLVLTPAWEPAFRWLPKRFGIRESCVASLAATALTLPVMAWHFGAVSVVSPLANLFVLPLVPPLMALSGVALAAAIIHPLLGAVVGLPAWALAQFLLSAVAAFGALPFAQAAAPAWSAVPFTLLSTALIWHAAKRSSSSSPSSFVLLPSVSGNAA